MDKSTGTKQPEQSVTFLPFKSRLAASRVLADETAMALKNALGRQRPASLVVSGGTSPVAYFHSLQGRDLAWQNITIIPSDERVVPAGHPDRNDAMIQRELLQGPASKARLTGLLPRTSGDDEIVFTTLESPFDVVVLGMGEDGHTASLFPDSPSIETTLSSTESTTRVEVPRLQVERVSLTPRALLTAHRVDLLFFGSAKREIFEEAMQTGPASTYPVRAVLHQDQVPVRVFWAP